MIGDANFRAIDSKLTDDVGRCVARNVSLLDDPKDTIFLVANLGCTAARTVAVTIDKAFGDEAAAAKAVILSKLRDALGLSIEEARKAERIGPHFTAKDGEELAKLMMAK